MIEFKRLALLILLTGANCFSFAQSAGDLGIVITASEEFRLGIEYRKPINEKLRYKIGVTQGGSGNVLSPNYDLYELTDSTFSTRHFSNQITSTNLRIGLERNLGISIFSIGFDLNLGYQNVQSDRANRNWILNPAGDWEESGIAPFFQGNEELLSAQITRHYFTPTARLSLNMDAPLGKGFILNFSISTNYGVPIYMGATNVIDPLTEYIGVPATTINWSTYLGAGLRYVINSEKKAK
ncbi:MAG: hypothetical protein GQ574_01195 [Crocinitomix sp.]|nr:hypothetical protein [Crocinitomix sp.]